MSANRIASVSVNAADPERLARFFIDALHFSPAGRGAPYALALGATRLDVLPAHGKPYPADITVSSPLFQHFAIAVSDMPAAMERLRHIKGWQPISVGGAEHLPANTGGVTAYKFRDPEGHPLEFISFPDEPAATSLFLRIDHSALSIENTARSEAFYRRFGLEAASRSLNKGREQEKLDDLPNAEVSVTALEFPSRSEPHVELLCYHGDFGRAHAHMEVGDVAATRLRLVASGMPVGVLPDPDGHFIEIIAPSRDE